MDGVRAAGRETASRISMAVGVVCRAIVQSRQVSSRVRA